MYCYKKNLGDYAKKAGRLSILQHGVYNLLIDSCYDREQFPSLEEAIDWVWASSVEEIEAVKFVLSKFFTLENGTYTQSRIKEEIENYHNFCEEQKIKGKLGGRPKKPNGIENKPNGLNNKPDHNPTITQSNPNQEPRTTNQEPLTNKNQDTMSGKPDGMAKKVVDVINYLNAKRATSYKPTAANARLIKARLAEGHSVSELLAVIDSKADEWGGSRKMAKFIRPATLFNAEKFSQYVGELSAQDNSMEGWLEEAEGLPILGNVIEGVFTNG